MSSDAAKADSPQQRLWVSVIQSHTCSLAAVDLLPTLEKLFQKCMLGPAGYYRLEYTRPFEVSNESL